MSKDKNDMAAAVTTSAPEESRGGKPISEPPPRSSSMAVYKPGEGYATRLGLMVVILAYVTFAARQWYYNWVFIPKTLRSIGLGFLTDWTENYHTGMQWLGTCLVAGTGLLVGYFYIYIKRESAEFLIKTDTELGKVTWPKISPWFKPETQVWGATYVVLIVLGVMTAYVFGIDIVLKKIADWLFYGK
jgi:preprotein translocase subunit SecE